MSQGAEGVIVEATGGVLPLFAEQVAIAHQDHCFLVFMKIHVFPVIQQGGNWSTLKRTVTPANAIFLHLIQIRSTLGTLQ